MSNVAIMPPRQGQVAHPLDDGKTLALIKRMYAPDATNDEFDVWVGLCRALQLDPRRKQVYLLVYNKDKPDKRRVVTIVGIDGFRSIAYRTGDYLPGAEPPVFEVDPSLKSDTNPEGLVKATVTVRKYFHGQILDYKAEAYWSEFAPITEEWAWNDEKGTRLPTGYLHPVGGQPAD
jgi:phage recombination protein Bet